MTDQRHAAHERPPAVEVDARRIVYIGTALWFVAFVLLLPWWSWLGKHDHRIWLWTCLAGWGLGIVGSLLMRRHRAQGRTI